MTLQELIFYCATTENGKRDFEKCYEKGRADAIECIISHLCVKDADYDNPIISPKFLKDYLDMMVLDGLEQLKEQKELLPKMGTNKI